VSSTAYFFATPRDAALTILEALGREERDVLVSQTPAVTRRAERAVRPRWWSRAAGQLPRFCGIGDEGAAARWAFAREAHAQ
jgi:hypothetical protein